VSAAVALATGSLFYVPEWEPGLQLALKWLGEEVSRG